MQAFLQLSLKYNLSDVHQTFKCFLTEIKLPIAPMPIPMSTLTNITMITIMNIIMIMTTLIITTTHRWLILKESLTDSLFQTV